jgi:hypothetical protein
VGRGVAVLLTTGVSVGRGLGEGVAVGVVFAERQAAVIPMIMAVIKRKRGIF